MLYLTKENTALVLSGPISFILWVLLFVFEISYKFCGVTVVQ